MYDRVKPNPDLDDLDFNCADLRSQGAELIITVGGGSSIDTGKALAFALSSKLDRPLHAVLREKREAEWQLALPIIAIPTTAGTGSEVTPFATVWDFANQRKYSLENERIFPWKALLVPELTVTQPWMVTLSAGLDTISHAIESLWNKNRNAVTVALAIQAIDLSLDTLLKLRDDPENILLRARIQEASLLAGLAIGQTHTALAHAISYYFTLSQGIPHGIAASLTLPAIGRFCAEKERDPSIRKLIRKIASDVSKIRERENLTHSIKHDRSNVKACLENFSTERSSNFLFQITPEEIEAVINESLI